MILRNALAVQTAAFCDLAGAFITAPLLIDHLGQSQYGVWLLMISVGAFLAVLDLGVSSAVTQYVAQDLATDDRASLDRTMAISLAIYLVIGLVCLAAHTGAAFSANILFSIPDQYQFPAFIGLLLLGFMVALAFPARLFEGVLRASENYNWLGAIDSAMSLTRLGLVIWVALGGGGLLYLTLAFMTPRLLSYLLYYLAALRILGIKRSPAPRWESQRLREMIRYSRDTLLILAGGASRKQLPSLTMGVFSTSLVAQYGVGSRLFLQASNFINSAVSVLKPRFVNLHMQNAREDFRRVLVGSCFYCGLMAGYIAVGAFLLAGEFIQLWIGDGFEGAKFLMRTLAIPFSIQIALLPFTQVLLALAKHRLNGYVELAEAAMVVAACWFLAPRWGMEGVAWGMLVAMCLIRPWLIPIYTCRKADFGVLEIVGKAYLLPVVTAILAGLLTAYGLSHWPVDTWPKFFAAMALISILYWALVWVIAFRSEQRSYWLKKFRSFLKLVLSRKN